MNDIKPTAADTAADTPTALLDAGRDLFAERGYEGASIRAITERAGANLGAVTYHFGSKRELYERVVAHAIQPLRHRVEEAASSEAPPLERVDAIVGILFEHLCDDPTLPRLVLQQLAAGQTPPPSARAWSRHFSGLLAALVREGQAAGTIRAGDPTLLALGVIAPSFHLHLMRPVFDETLDLHLEEPATRERVLDHVRRLVRAGLEVR